MNTILNKADTDTDTLAKVTNNDFKAIDMFTRQEIITNKTDNKEDILANQSYQDKSNRPSAYTSRGIKKAEASDSIKSLDEIKQIIDYFNSKQHYRDSAIFQIGIQMGMRAGDLLSMKMYDVLNDDGTFKERIHIYEEKTGKLNTAKITNTIQFVINEYIKLLKQKNKEYNIKNHMNDYLFMSNKGWNQPITQESLHKIIHTMGKDTGLNNKYNLGSHSLRKTFSYWMIKLHENDPEAMRNLQIMLNHSSMITTMRYAGINQEKVDSMRSDFSNVLENM